MAACSKSGSPLQLPNVQSLDELAQLLEGEAGELAVDLNAYLELQTAAERDPELASSILQATRVRSRRPRARRRRSRTNKAAPWKNLAACEISAATLHDAARASCGVVLEGISEAPGKAVARLFGRDGFRRRRRLLRTTIGHLLPARKAVQGPCYKQACRTISSLP